MLRVAYVFERFPSFGQTFCYREVAELLRQGAEVEIFSIRRPKGELAQDWDEDVTRRVTYLPEEAELVREVERAARAGELPKPAIDGIREWDRQPDFLRLYQAAFIGARLQAAGIGRVHAHFAGIAARTAFWIWKVFGIEFSFTAHANDIFAPRPFVVSLEKLCAAAGAVVTVSDFAVAQLRAQFPREAAKFHRVYNGIEPARFRAADFASEVPLILSIGRLIEKKGFGNLIQACASLTSRGVNFRCEIIGEGPLEETLRVQTAALGLQDRVQLAGPRTQTQIVERLAAATVFVLPCVRDEKGDMDNLPTVIMEAMAAGLPVVSTNLAGIPEMVLPEATGLLVRPHDPEALAGAVARILSEPALARSYGASGRAVAEEKFSVSKNITNLAKILATR
ncbi:MAG: glycosyltransferase family 4 protein [Chthoniobacterales bacterium]